MGMNSNFEMVFKLKYNIKLEIKEYIDKFNSNIDTDIKLNHEFFKDDRCGYIRIKKHGNGFFCEANVKDYDDIIDKFFDWIYPCIEYPNHPIIGNYWDDFGYKGWIIYTNKDLQIFYR